MRSRKNVLPLAAAVLVAILGSASLYADEPATSRDPLLRKAVSASLSRAIQPKIMTYVQYGVPVWDASGNLAPSVIHDHGGFVGIGIDQNQVPLSVVTGSSSGIFFSQMTGGQVKVQGTSATFATVNPIVLQGDGGAVGIGRAPLSPFNLDAYGLSRFYNDYTELYFADMAAGSTHYLKIQGGTAANNTVADIIMQPDGGNVVIGPSGGTYSLIVNGTVTGTRVNATYQDVAEWVQSDEPLSPGTVVVLNRKQNNEVLQSKKAYDTAVAGVVSEKPGVLLGVAGANKAQVATTGRVKVRVDATRAPIEIGDLLVTSDVAGTAMKSQPIEINGRQFHQPGTIIGKALEPLASGEGEILVLLSLQ